MAAQNERKGNISDAWYQEGVSCLRYNRRDMDKLRAPNMWVIDGELESFPSASCIPEGGPFGFLKVRTT